LTSIYQQELGFKEQLTFLEYWVSNFSAKKETHDLMSDLVQAGIPIGLLTNIYLGTFEAAVKIGAIPNLDYSTVIQSCNVGYVKPEPEIYEIAQSESGSLPQNIIFIDDKIPFLTPAKALGWTTIHFEEQTSDVALEKIRNLAL